MREYNLNEFTKRIAKNKSNINRTILANNEIGRIKTRTRDKDEAKILDIITESRWKKAIEQGKLLKTAENTYDYFFD